MEKLSKNTTQTSANTYISYLAKPPRLDKTAPSMVKIGKRILIRASLYRPKGDGFCVSNTRRLNDFNS